MDGILILIFNIFELQGAGALILIFKIKIDHIDFVSHSLLSSSLLVKSRNLDRGNKSTSQFYTISIRFKMLGAAITIKTTIKFSQLHVLSNTNSLITLIYRLSTFPHANKIVLLHTKIQRCCWQLFNSSVSVFLMLKWWALNNNADL